MKMVFKCVRDYESKYGLILAGELCLVIFNDENDFYLIHENKFYLSEDELDEFFRRIYWRKIDRFDGLF